MERAEQRESFLSKCLCITAIFFDILPFKTTFNFDIKYERCVRVSSVYLSSRLTNMNGSLISGVFKELRIHSSALMDDEEGGERYWLQNDRK